MSHRVELWEMCNEPSLVRLLFFHRPSSTDEPLHECVKRRVDRIRASKFDVSVIASKSLDSDKEWCFWVRLFSCNELVLPLLSLSGPMQQTIHDDVVNGLFTHLDTDNPYKGCVHYKCHSQWEKFRDRFSLQSLISNAMVWLAPLSDQTLIRCGLLEVAPGPGKRPRDHTESHSDLPNKRT